MCFSEKRNEVSFHEDVTDNHGLLTFDFETEAEECYSVYQKLKKATDQFCITVFVTVYDSHSCSTVRDSNSVEFRKITISPTLFVIC